MEVRLRLKDTIFRQLTLADGKFLFKIKRAPLTATLDISTSSQTKSKEKYLCVFFGDNVNVIELEKAPILLTKKIELRANELTHCIPEFAEIFFSKNSAIPTVAVSYDTIPIETAIKNYHSLLIDFPKLKIEINGYSDYKELNKVNLSTSRANYVANKLISMGVSKSQLVVKSYGDQRPFQKNNFSDQDPFRYTKDKNILAQRNQRVSFKILTFGFDNDSPTDEEH